MITWVTSAVAAALTAHTVVNVAGSRRPPDRPRRVSERVSVLLPVRDEAHQVGPTVQALLRVLDACPGAELVVLDDGSIDGTADVVADVVAGSSRRAEGHGASAAVQHIGGDLNDGVAEKDGGAEKSVAGPPVRVVAGERLPEGWLGKSWACDQLARLADPRSGVLVFVDADVLLEPHAVAAAIQLLRDNGLDVVCPYPRQVAEGVAERVVQPLLQWSWLTTLPLRRAERSRRPSLTAANGQLLVVDRHWYRLAGGHARVRGAVLEDLALVRAIKAVGGRGGVVDGSRVASCRMYRGWSQLRDGYTKSLWVACGGPARGVVVATGLVMVYVWPAVAAVFGSRVGAVGYLAGVLGRVLTAHRTGGRCWPDAVAHPASVLTLGWLMLRSVHGRRRGTLRWKGRSIR
ncbi:MAG: glycosyltransferase family 2 protein [Angustibacter sp.]